MRRVIFFVILTTSLFLASCSSGQPGISIEAASLDLGNVVNGDIVGRDLTLINEGNADLVINSIVTSCTCTQATINPMTIAANQAGILHIEFDSGFHGPDLTGPLIRQIFINSNDPQQPELTIELSVSVEAKDS
jgi:hypothetical protein